MLKDLTTSLMHINLTYQYLVDAKSIKSFSCQLNLNLITMHHGIVFHFKISSHSHHLIQAASTR